MLRKLVAEVVASIVAVLVPLAYGSPPDPTWIAGIYDNADYDDVVLAITSADGAFDTAEAAFLITPWSSVRLDVAPETARPCFSYNLEAGRAPPLK